MYTQDHAKPACFTCSVQSHCEWQRKYWQVTFLKESNKEQRKTESHLHWWRYWCKETKNRWKLNYSFANATADSSTDCIRKKEQMKDELLTCTRHWQCFVSFLSSRPQPPAACFCSSLLQTFPCFWTMVWSGQKMCYDSDVSPIFIF